MLRSPEECYITLEGLQQLINAGCGCITVIINGQFYDVKEVKKNVSVDDPITTD